MRPKNHPNVEKFIEAAERGELPFGTTRTGSLRLISWTADPMLEPSESIRGGGFAHVLWVNETRRRAPIEIECRFKAKLAEFHGSHHPAARILDDLVRITTSIRGWSTTDVFFPFEPCDTPIAAVGTGTETLSSTLGEHTCESMFKAFANVNSAQEEEVKANRMASKRFKVALSFPGERRVFVEGVATELALNLTKSRIFYDRFHQPELARLNLDTYLQRIYHDDSEAVVVFLCKEFELKDWCGLEWRAIRDLIKMRRDEIMLVRFDDTDVSGVFGIDGYLDASSKSPKEVAGAIQMRFNL